MSFGIPQELFSVLSQLFCRVDSAAPPALLAPPKKICILNSEKAARGMVLLALNEDNVYKSSGYDTIVRNNIISSPDQSSKQREQEE